MSLPLRIVLAFLAGLLVAAVIGTAAHAEYTNYRLDEIGTKIAKTAQGVHCMTPSDLDSQHNNLFNSEPLLYGYVYPILDPHDIYLRDETVCAGLRELLRGESTDARLDALGILVLTHEALHQAVRFSNRTDEAWTECRALQHFRYTGYLLTQNPSLAFRLFPEGLNWHYGLPMQYHLRDCNIPSWP